MNFEKPLVVLSAGLVALSTGVAFCVLSRGDRLLIRSLERARIQQLDLADGSLADVADYLSSQLETKGILCDVVVDHRIANRTVPNLMIGQGTGILFIHGVC